MTLGRVTIDPAGARALLQASRLTDSAALLWLLLILRGAEVGVPSRAEIPLGGASIRSNLIRIDASDPELEHLLGRMPLAGHELEGASLIARDARAGGLLIACPDFAAIPSLGMGSPRGPT